MASWSELVKQFDKKKGDPKWVLGSLRSELDEISKLRGGTAVIFYASAFLQKQNNLALSITREDINGFMDAMYKAKTDKGLTLILHTPGGDPNAVESIVDYLHAKFTADIEVVVPYLAMSGGAMISLASNLIILGKQSQLGPIDPQFSIRNKTHSARAIKDAFDQAKKDIENSVKLAHLWAPILQSMGPSLVIEAEKALSYSKQLVEKWLEERMFGCPDYKEENRKEIVNRIAAYFNAEKTNSDERVYVHGQGIRFEKLKELGVKVRRLEDDQNLQTAVMTAYHLMTLIFERTPCLKFISSNKGTMWLKQQPVQTQGPRGSHPK